MLRNVSCLLQFLSLQGDIFCPEGIQTCNMENRDICWRDKIQETLYTRQWGLSPLQSCHLGTSHSSPSVPSIVQNTLKNPLLKSPSAVSLYFPESHEWSEISSLSKVILVLGKARSHRAPNLCCRGAESPGWFDVLSKYVMREQVCCCD